MKINGNVVTVQKPAKELYEHFINVANFEGLMPENIEKFEVDGESFLFGLKGMPEIRLVLKEKIPYSNVILGAASSKLSFNLDVNIDEIAENESEVQLKFAGDFNMMMAMMVKKPLTKFISTLTENIEKL